jgi:hypothetical protein
MGQNINYYLLKSDIVVCVEANLECVEYIKNKYHVEIQNKKLFIEGTVVSQTPTSSKNFYVNKNNLLSTTIKPPNTGKFITKKVKNQSIINILNKYLVKDVEFYYAKFDLEGADETLIRCMFAGGYYPKNISYEVLTLESLDIILQSGKYKGFKLLSGRQVSSHTNLKIKQNTTYSFLENSAGPMGEDLPGPWLSGSSIKTKLKAHGTHWIDIHATMDLGGHVAKNRRTLSYIILILRTIYSITPNKLKTSNKLQKTILAIKKF